MKRRGFAGGSSGAISVHSSSSMIGLPISSILLSRRSRLQVVLRVNSPYAAFLKPFRRTGYAARLAGV
ncbi:hypothetical protein HDG41_007118 [Paraburkholderia sp. JPY162]|uniref:Uncharacterized protein n=1 Tax=Paraburkholderia youngii TaxID=2782701 RepID=A0A7W8LDH8_9BURK|nr:hypothetical protein [Paraburkholderia youngii]